MDLDFVSCPFNPLHRVMKAHLQRHIIRCMLNYPDWVPCIYNAMHRFQSKEEMMEHIKACPSRMLITGQQAGESKTSSNTALESRKFHLREENWDEEYD